MSLVPGYTNFKVHSYLRMMVASQPNWAAAACLAIYKQLTNKERRMGVSFEHDRIGFNRVDTPKLTSIARSLKCNQQLQQDYDTLMVLMPKYVRQLALISDKKVLKEWLDKYYKNKRLKLPI